MGDLVVMLPKIFDCAALFASKKHQKDSQTSTFATHALLLAYRFMYTACTVPGASSPRAILKFDDKNVHFRMLLQMRIGLLDYFAVIETAESYQ